jgi:glutamine amidotransferase
MPRLENWVNVPTNSILTIHNQTVMVHPILDRYYDRSPYHKRSAKFVQTRGLAANEKTLVSASATPLSTPGAELEVRQSLGRTTTFGVLRSLTPDLSNAASHSGPSQSGTRSPEPPTVILAVSAQPRDQGNIKKRASLVSIGTGSLSSEDSDPQSPLTPEQPRTVLARPNKLARYFPELVLS